MENKIKVAITQGDTNGVGLEVAIKALSAEGITDLFTPILFANHALAKATLKMLGVENMPYFFTNSAENIKNGKINVVNVGAAPLIPTYGERTPAGGAAAVESLEAACNAIDDGFADVLVTAPIDKSTAQADDFHFPGHTEYLQERFAEEGERAMMILFDANMRVALLTTHLPLAKVSEHVNKLRIEEYVESLAHTLVSDFSCERPRIAVLSLNPHCGDNGLLGTEEQTEIIPAIEALRDKGLLVFGPFPADGFFGGENRYKFDGILAMYHDQGLASFKALAGSEGVNFTAGLPIVRTSPDHGTAYDIAGRGEADASSMRNAIYQAIDIYRSRETYEEISANPLKIAKEKPERRGKDADKSVE